MKGKGKSTGSISFEKNVNDNYYTITVVDNEGNEGKIQALIFDKEKVQRDIEKKEKLHH